MDWSNWEFNEPLWLAGLALIPLAALGMGLLRAKRFGHFTSRCSTVFNSLWRDL